DLAGVGVFFAEQHAQERGLSRAVRPDDADPLPAFRLETDRQPQRLVAVRFAQIADRQHAIARALICSERQTDLPLRLELLHHRIAGEHAVEPLLAPLRFPAALPGAESADEFLLLLDVFLLLLVLALLAQLLHLALLDERRVISRITL